MEYGVELALSGFLYLSLEGGKPSKKRSHSVKFEFYKMASREWHLSGSISRMTLQWENRSTNFLDWFRNSRGFIFFCLAVQRPEKDEPIDAKNIYIPLRKTPCVINLNDIVI